MPQDATMGGALLPLLPVPPRPETDRDGGDTMRLDENRSAGASPAHPYTPMGGGRS